MEDNKLENGNAASDNKGNADSPLNLNCICRQRKHTTMISCVMCCELFHCDCMSFCQGLAKVTNINYLCPNCIFTFIKLADNDRCD